MQLLQATTPRAGSADRIAAKVVPGVGFLGAGVIIRDGLNIRGVNTAATCAAAVGALAGAGLLSFGHDRRWGGGACQPAVAAAGASHRPPADGAIEVPR